MHAVYTLCLYKLTSYYMGNCTFVKKRVGIKMQEISNSKFHRVLVKRNYICNFYVCALVSVITERVLATGIKKALFYKHLHSKMLPCMELGSFHF